MRNYKVIISTDAPSVRDAIWAKPVSGGFTLYLMNNGAWQPAKVVDDSGAPIAIPSDVSKAYIESGAFNKKPSSATKGQMYFCTNKQTTEGQADGIPIFYNGTNWVDALGRTVS